ncbi:uncharacterized protein LOC133788245 isoform X2 [Humulus lupulus]|nr:uncharacterized protein LOC133788245 isoform X2 [Humulus lupulus]
MYNRGAAGLAYCYEQMDDLCRQCTTSIGGLWKAWEVWGREYIPSLRVTSQCIMSKVFPRSLLWISCPLPSMEHSILLDYYREILDNLTFKDVQWFPWGERKRQPAYVRFSEQPNTRRILLLGLHGGEWYLAERVTMQSYNIPQTNIPKIPPKSMIVKEKTILISNNWCLAGKPGRNFFKKSTKLTYDEYISLFLSSNNNEERKCIAATGLLARLDGVQSNLIQQINTTSETFKTYSNILTTLMIDLAQNSPTEPSRRPTIEDNVSTN